MNKNIISLTAVYCSALYVLFAQSLLLLTMAKFKTSNSLNLLSWKLQNVSWILNKEAKNDFLQCYTIGKQTLSNKYVLL